MSSLIVKVCVVDEIRQHPSADRMAIAVIKGWQTCVGRDPATGVTQFKAGDKCVYFPPDTVLNGPLAERLGVAKYLQPLPKNERGVRPDGGRIRVARLRGEKSYGLIIACEDSSWEDGKDMVAHYGVTKYDPPQPCTDGDAERPHPAFHRYTDIENFRNFPDMIKEGEVVVFTEKLHGKNTRLALIRDQAEDGSSVMTFMVGSHDVRRKECAVLNKTVRDPQTKEPILDADGQIQKTIETRKSQFWDCLTDNVREMLTAVSKDNGDANVVLFGEMIGQGVQDMTYGTRFGFRAFDISVNGKYLDHDKKASLFKEFSVESVPTLYHGPFSKDKLEEFVDGPTTMCEEDVAGHFKGREGIVITPVKERRNMDLHGEGRVILKAVSFFYLERKNGTEFH